jgi:hypothetical protein
LNHHVQRVAEIAPRHQESRQSRHDSIDGNGGSVQLFGHQANGEIPVCQDPDRGSILLDDHTADVLAAHAARRFCTGGRGR